MHVCARVCVCGYAHMCVSEMMFFVELPAFLSVFALISPPCLNHTHFCLVSFLLFSLPLLSSCRVQTRGQRKARRGWTATLGDREGGTGKSEVDGSDAVQRGPQGRMPSVDSSACPAGGEPCPALREPDTSPQSPPRTPESVPPRGRSRGSDALWPHFLFCA